MKGFTDVSGSELIEKIMEGERDFTGIRLPQDTDLTSEEGFEDLSLYLATLPGKELKREPLIFNHSKMYGLNAPGLYIPHSKARRTNLEKANLKNTELDWVDFRRANLRGVDFREAKLYDTNFTGANVKNANFSDSVLKGHSLQNAIGRHHATYDGIIILSKHLEARDLKKEPK